MERTEEWKAARSR